MNAVLLSGLSVFILVLTHWLTPHLRKACRYNNAILNSMGAGFSLGYVFLHMIPSFLNDLPSFQHGVSSSYLLNEKKTLFTVFLVVISGFCSWYWLEKLAHSYTKKGLEAGKLIYCSHIGMMSYLSFTIGASSLMVSQDGYHNLMVFTFVMGLSFLLEDHSLNYHFPTQFKKQGRYIIMLGLVCGWLFSLLIHDSMKIIVEIVLNAFLAGALVLSVAKTEFSLLEDKSHFPTFIISLFVKALIVFAMLALEDKI